MRIVITKLIGGRRGKRLPRIILCPSVCVLRPQCEHVTRNEEHLPCKVTCRSPSAPAHPKMCVLRVSCPLSSAVCGCRADNLSSAGDPILPETFPAYLGLVKRTPHTWTRPPSFPLGKQCSSCQRTRCGDGGLHHILCQFLTFPPWNSFVKSSCTDGRLHHSILADASASHIEKASRDNPLHSSWLPRHPSFQSRISSCCGTGSACIANE